MLTRACPTPDECSVVLELRAEIERLRAALKPFADYADPRNTVPADFRISAGSTMARKQLTMGDCYRARAALNRPDGT